MYDIPIHLTTRRGLLLTCPLCPFRATLRPGGVRVDVPGSAAHTGALPWGWWRWLREQETQEGVE